MSEDILIDLERCTIGRQSRPRVHINDDVSTQMLIASTYASLNLPARMHSCIVDGSGNSELSSSILHSLGITDVAMSDDPRNLFPEIGDYLKNSHQCLFLQITNLDHYSDHNLSSLISGVHSISQKNYPIVFVGYGSDLLKGRMFDLREYSDRLFNYFDMRTYSSNAPSI